VATVRRGDGAGAVRRVGVGVAVERGAPAPRDACAEPDRAEARGFAAVDADGVAVGLARSGLSAAAGEADGDPVASDAIADGAGADAGAGLEATGVGHGDAATVEAALGEAGKVISSSPSSPGAGVDQVVGAGVGFAAVAVGRLTAGASVVTTPNTAPPATIAPHAMTRFRGVSCMTSPRQVRSRASGAPH
jgi:hypothetical protein